jgi:acetylornithine aminotransferase
VERYQAAALGVFNPHLVLERGQGAQVWDVDGREYLDLLGGIAVNVLGQAHPVWLAALAGQAGRLAHISNLYTSRPQIELAERLAALAAGPRAKSARVFLTNSGTEANEAALKAVLRQGGGRHQLLALEGSFHGRTLGALSLTAKEAYRKPFDGFTGPVRFLTPGDLTSLEAALAQGDVAALVLEVIQGEAGVVPLPPGYLNQARQLTRQYGALLWIDEVQTGTGRTGTWFAYLNEALVGPERIEPDLVTVAKGLGGGFPIGAMIALTEQTANLLAPGDHGTTFGGNPLACAAALATLEVIEQDDLLGRTAQFGAAWRRELAAIPGVKTARGAGLLVGIVLEKPIAAQVVRRAETAGFLINAPAPDVLRLAPPLVLTEAQAKRFTAALPRLLKEET